MGKRARSQVSKTREKETPVGRQGKGRGTRNQLSAREGVAEGKWTVGVKEEFKLEKLTITPVRVQ